MHLIVPESADRNRSQPHGNSLQVNILGYMTYLDADIPGSAVPIPSLRPLVLGSDNDVDRSFLYEFLIQRRLGQFREDIVLRDFLELMLLGGIVVDPILDSHIDLQRV